MLEIWNAQCHSRPTTAWACKRAGPFDIHTFPFLAHVPVFAHTTLYRDYIRKNFFSAASMNLQRSGFVPSGMRIRDPMVREPEDGTEFKALV